MRQLKTIRLVYIVYTMYTLFVITVSDYSIGIAIGGLISIWSIFFAYCIGFMSIKGYSQKSEVSNDNDDWFFFSSINNWRINQYIIVAIISWICSIMAARYYTGRGFFRVITGLFQGEKAYSIYQHYIIEANIGTFSFAKIPFILMLTFCTVMLFWSMTGLLLSKERITIFQIIFLLLIIGAYLYFGLARGTNFEMYIIFVLFAYCLLTRSENSMKERGLRRKYIIILSLLALVVVMIFRTVVAARGNVFQNQICTEIHYDSEKSVSKLFPTVTNIGLSVFRYFGFGIFTIGMAIDRIVFESISGMVAFCLPMGFNFVFSTSFMALVRDTVDIGIGWVPDYFSLLNMFGLPCTLCLFYFIGRLSCKLHLSERAALLKNLLGAAVFIEMLSIPVGNFITTSTPNEITLILILLWYIKGNWHISLGGKRII